MTMRLGHYDIVEELGRGGMGVVYKGYESSLGRFVAIKALSATMAHDKVFVERFLREARAMATLNDSHIIQIYFIGQDEGQTFFVMEYIDGDSLSGFIKRDGRLDPSDALKILLHTAQGLAVAHAQGVIHRDVKPGNIMITSRGQVKVADFGIAIANHDFDSKLTGTGQLVGTPGYLSPEVCLGKPVDARSDIFALGIVLFEMLTGRMPFLDESPLKLMLDVVQAEAPNVRELAPDVDEEAARILSKMLAKDPADRYQTCHELIADLKRHPIVSQSGPLKLRASARAGANPSDPTVVGIPTPMTPAMGMRRSTPPPVVSSGGTPSMAGNASADAATMVTPAPQGKRSRTGLIAAGVLTLVGIGVLAWAFMTGRLGGQPMAPAAISTPAADAPAGSVAAAAAASVSTPMASAPTASALPAMTSDGAPAASLVPAMAVEGASAASLAPATGLAAVPTIHYGHGGPNTSVNRIRVRAEHEPTPDELLAREQARLQNEAAAQAAATAAQQAAAPAPAPAKAVKPAKVGFMCRVFKKCDPPKKPAPASPPPPPPSG